MIVDCRMRIGDLLASEDLSTISDLALDWRRRAFTNKSPIPILTLQNQSPLPSPQSPIQQRLRLSNAPSHKPLPQVLLRRARRRDALLRTVDHGMRRRSAAKGVEHYDGWFRSFEPEDVDPIVRAMDETGQVTSMICFSPDFTHPDRGERRRQVERQKTAIDLTVRLGARHCRTLSGQRHPGMSRAEGVARTLDGIRRSLEYAGEARRRPVHGEPLQGRDVAVSASSRSRKTSFSKSWSGSTRRTSACSTTRRTPSSADSIPWRSSRR